MNRYMPITVSAIFLIMTFFPCQVLAASITQTKAEIGESCTASGLNSTAMGYRTIASGLVSTTMGLSTEAGGFCSWAGGLFMQLTDTAENTFVWGHADSAQSIPTADAFLIFPAGTAGKVGIGTMNPNRHLTINGTGGTYLNVKGNDGLYEVLLGADSAGGVVSTMTNHDLTGGNSTKMTIKANGKVGIGTEDPYVKLDIVGGDARVETGYNWLTNSDFRLKKNISTLDGSLEKISRLRGVRFDTKEANSVEKGAGKHIGVIAQELEKEYPELVVGDEKTGYKAVAYDKLTAVLIEAVKELKTKNQAQEEDLQQQRLQFQKQQAEIEELRSMIKELKS